MMNNSDNYSRFKAVLLLAFLWGAVVVQAAMSKPDFDFYATPGQKPENIKLEPGASFASNGLLHIGAGGRALIPELSSWNINEEGFTAVMTCKTDRPDLIGFFGKSKVFETRLGGFLWTDIFAEKGTLNRVGWNKKMPKDQYVQLAVTAQFIDDPPSGRNGYMFTAYLNGELVTMVFFNHMKYFTGDGDFWLGNSRGGFELCGDIAEFKFYKRPLTAGEIYQLTVGNEFIAEKGYEIPSNEKNAFAKTADDTPKMAWLREALKRSLEMGDDARKVGETANALLQADAFDQFNNAQKHFKLVETPDLIWLVSLENGREPALAAVFDKRTQSELSGKRLLRWIINTNSGDCTDADKGITSEVIDWHEDSGITEFVIHWNHPKFEAFSNVKIAGPRLEADLRIDNQNLDLELQEIHYPQFNVKPAKETGYKEVRTSFCGRTKDIDFYSTYYYFNDYPSLMSVQFGGIYDENGNGVYTGFEESSPVCKKIGFGGIGGCYRNEYATLGAISPGTKGGNSYESRGPAVLEVYKGKWYEMGQIYKRFLKERTNWLSKELPRLDTPEWYRNNPFWLLAGEPEQILYLREYLELPFAFDTTGWWCENYEPGTPEAPYIKDIVNIGAEKTLGTEKSLEWLKKFHDAGIYCRVYFNVRLWAFVQRWCSSKDKDFDLGPEGLKNSIKTESGSPFKEVYSKPVFVMCPGTEKWQEIMYANIKKIAELGLDGVYLDQSVDAHFQPCYDPTHGHDLQSPYIWHQGYFRVLDKVRTEMRKSYPNFTMDGEGGTDVWTPKMDGFLSWLFTGVAEHVPLLQSILGGGYIQFVARGSEAHLGVGSYDAFFARMAEQFVCSEQLGWIHIYDFEFSGMGRRLFTKKLAHLRTALLDYFNASDMLAPLEFTTKMPELTCSWGCVNPNVTTTDSIRHAVWRRMSDGRIVIPFVNTTEEAIAIQPILPFTGKLTICREGQATAEEYDAAKPPMLNLGSHESQIWFVDCGKGTDEEHIKKVCSVMAKIPAWDDGVDFEIPQDFHKCNQLTASPGHWIIADDVSWVKGMFKVRKGAATVGYDPRHGGENASGWMFAKDGGEAFFGEVDFGNEAKPRFIEVELSATAEGAGGKVRLVDVDDKGKMLAEAEIPNSGKYFVYAVVKVPLDKTVTGKHKVSWIFDKPVLLRRWRMAE